MTLFSQTQTWKIFYIIHPPPALDQQSGPITDRIKHTRAGLDGGMKNSLLMIHSYMCLVWGVFVCVSILGSRQSWRTFQLVGGETFDELYCQVTIFSSHGAIQFNSNKYLLKIVCQGLWETSKEKSLKPKILDVWEPRHGFLGQSDDMRWGKVTLGF